MEKRLNNIKDDINDLVEYIKESDKYKRYLIVKDKMSKDKTIMSNIKRVKELQKIIVNLEYNKKDITKEEKEINNILEELKNYPIYSEYSYLVEDLNYEIKYIKETLETEINKIVN